MRILTLFALLFLSACNFNGTWELKPPVPSGPALRIAGRLYLLTSQTRLRFTEEFDTIRIAEREFFTDLWAFDIGSAAPLWRKRLHVSTNANAPSAAILGAEGDTLWIFLPDGLAAASASNGRLLANSASFEAKNPPLQGVFPKQHSSFTFGANGLHLQAADGRYWSIHPQSFSVQPPNTPSSTAIAPAYRAISSPRAFLSRGLSIPGRWLGLLDDPEAAQIRNTRAMFPDLERSSRRRLWGARMVNGAYTELTPLTAEFLDPGLLGAARNKPLLLSNPDSVLLLHQDRLDETRRYQLTRIAGPAGNTVWHTPLPFSIVQSVLPASDSLVLLGVQFTPPPDNKPRDPLHTAKTLITFLQLGSGAQQTYDLSDVSQNPPAAAP